MCREPGGARPRSEEGAWRKALRWADSWRFHEIVPAHRHADRGGAQAGVAWQPAAASALHARHPLGHLLPKGWQPGRRACADTGMGAALEQRISQNHPISRRRDDQLFFAP